MTKINERPGACKTPTKKGGKGGKGGGGKK